MSINAGSFFVTLVITVMLKGALNQISFHFFSLYLHFVLVCGCFTELQICV